MKNNSLISIIVPIFNIEDYLDKCIKSILSQTYTNLEIILIDDGSTDKSGKICEYYASQDKRVKVIHKENGGLVSARKKGLEIATGNYIGFVDGDDYILETMYEKLLMAIEKSNADIIDSGYYCNGEIRVKQEYILEKNKYDICEILKEKIMGSRIENLISPSIWSKLFRRDIIMASYSLVPDMQSYGEDLICLTACICANVTMYYIREAYYCYNLREESLSHYCGVENYCQEANLCQALKTVLHNYEYYEKLQPVLQQFLVWHIKEALEKNIINPFSVQRFAIEHVEKMFDKKVIIYGAGSVGRSFYVQLSRYARCRIVGWVDKNFHNYRYECCEILSPDFIGKCEHDYILLANADENIRRKMKVELLELYGVSENEIISEVPILI